MDLNRVWAKYVVDSDNHTGQSTQIKSRNCLNRLELIFLRKYLRIGVIKTIFKQILNILNTPDL